MSEDLTERTIALSQQSERLRQERETFDQAKEKDRRSFRLRMAMGWVACGMLPAVAVACFLVLALHERFTEGTVTLAAAALFVDVLGCVLAVWRAFAGGKPETLAPVTSPSSPSTGTLTSR